MDSITQGLLGAVTAQLGFRQRIGGDATWVAAAAAVVPDLDILVPPVLEALGLDLGPLSQAVVHRGVSHSLLAAPLLALPIALVWWLLRRRRGSRPPPGVAPPGPGLLFACVLVAVLTQPLLDWFTSYGVQLLAPLSHHRFALDAVGIVDLIYTGALVLTLVGCAAARRREEGRGRRLSLVVGWTGMILSAAYLGAGLLARDAAAERVQARFADRTVLRLQAYPMIGSIFLWRVVVETPDAWHAVRVHHLADEAAPLRSATVVKERSPWIARARQTDLGQQFGWFADGMLRGTHRRQGADHVVELHDMRYAVSSEGVESLWTLRQVLAPDGTVRSARRTRHRRARGLKNIAAHVWSDMWNP